eukprot:14743725-Alexandrium_andersonii.AAC.1
MRFGCASFACARVEACIGTNDTNGIRIELRMYAPCSATSVSDATQILTTRWLSALCKGSVSSGVLCEVVLLCNP